MALNNRNGGDRPPQRERKTEHDFDMTPVQKALESIRSDYDHVASRNGLTSDQEFGHVWCILTGNMSLLEQACAETQQLTRALKQQASIGLSLDPSRQYSYLTLRRGQLIFDVGYRGLIKLAVDEGLIRSAKPELVYEKDRFEYRGPSNLPLHQCADIFGDRGRIVGAYCESRLANGDLMIEVMKESEFIEISMNNPKSDAWKKDFSSGEMRKKTIVKRAAKWWYNSSVGGSSNAGARLNSAVHYLNTEAGEGVVPDSQDETVAEPIYNPDDASEKARTFVTNVINRATATNAWTAAEQLCSERLKGPDLAYANKALQEAKPNAQQQGQNADQQQSAGAQA